MTIVSQNFATLVANQVAAIQGAATKLVDLTIGSILRAVVEANAAVALWLQGLVLTLLAKTRAATSNGADLDSWVGDFGLTRLPAVATTGAVTFARFTPTNAATIPIGSVVQSGDGSQKYTVTIDATNPAYSAGAGGYVIAAGVSSVTVPVQNTVAGAAGNAAAGVVSVL
ncbi:MAG: baseplate J/gp47 family protein, partial [Betaproteobacteria bacterium]|nr:baseplate J/gp47 family protein [Betaproteobacteria bacterium]